MGKLEGVFMLKDQKGMTLVELLAALALMSIIIALIGSAHILGQKQFRNQTEEINYQEQVRLAMASITKEIRTSNGDQVTISDGIITIDTTTYELRQSSLYKNESIISEQISEFTAIKQGGKIDVSISSLPNRNDKKETLSTVIYLRE